MAPTIDDTAWLKALDLVIGALDQLPLGEAQARCRVGKARFNAAELRMLAAEVTADGDDTRARRLAGAGGHRSKRAARAAAARAAAVSKNPSLADDLDKGALSDEKLDTIADVMQSDESAATDDEFIDAIKKRSVDQGKKLARERKNSGRGGESQAKRQRRLRHARRYDDRAAGLSAITFAGDDATIGELWRLVRQRERQLRESDGGRDLPSRDHPRSLDQRLFDAMADLIRGTASPVGRPSSVVVVPVDGQAYAVGDGPLSDDVAADLLGRSSVSILLVDKMSGDPLWLSRGSRHASSGQFLALVVRDKGCVLCGADWTTCHVHHLTPWNAPAKGETDIDKLALVCPDDHHHLHQAHLTLERLSDGTWKTRPATPDEIAPAGPTRSGRPPSMWQRAQESQSSDAWAGAMRGARKGASSQSGQGCATSCPADSPAGLRSDNPSLRPRPGQTTINGDGAADDEAIT